MSEFLEQSVFFGVSVSLTSYGLGMLLKKRFRSVLCNPLLISVALTILVLLVLGIDYDAYYEGAKYLSYLMTPATVSLAIPLYEKMALLKQHYKAVLAGIVSGIFSGMLTILLLAIWLRLGHAEFVTLLPKSVTTAIGIVISEELGGYVSVTAAVIVITGILGNVLAESIFSLFRITEPIARGVALGTASHAMGTAKAMELGEVEGAMSSLSIVVAGITTVLGVLVFSQFI